MTSLIAWVGADTHGPASLNIASDSRITWSIKKPISHQWDEAKKVFSSVKEPVIIGYVGDVLFPALVLPGLIERIDRGFFQSGESLAEGVIAALRRGWRDYPHEERRETNIYIGSRIGEKMSAEFKLHKISNMAPAVNDWRTEEIKVPRHSSCLVIDGSGKEIIKKNLVAWQSSSAGGTSRAIFCGFVDSIVSRIDPASGGAPQLASLYRIGVGRPMGIIHDKQRFFAGTRLIGKEKLDGVEWRNDLFERVDGDKKKLMSKAQPQPRPSMQM